MIPCLQLPHTLPQLKTLSSGLLSVRSLGWPRADGRVQNLMRDWPRYEVRCVSLPAPHDPISISPWKHLEQNDQEEFTALPL